MTIDPRMLAHLVASFDARFMDEWTADAACRGDRRRDVLGGVGRLPAGEVWAQAFADDVAAVPVHQEYTWSASVLEVMRTCAGCTVRRECLEAAYREEHEEREERATWDAAWFEEPDEQADSGRCYGVRGGLPGRMRERFDDEPDRLERSEAWFQNEIARRGWASTNEEGVAL